MKIAFIGDICLARQINTKFQNEEYEIVDKEVINFLNDSDFVMANLESPICENADKGDDHLSFWGRPKMLVQFSFVDYFSLSNNHINDCGTLGMIETINSLEENGISHNGLFKNVYEPIILPSKTEKIAILTCTDMMNVPFSKENSLNTLHIDDHNLNSVIKKYKSQNYFIILYAHVGILFSRFVNPPIRNLLHEKMDLGVDVIVTAHSHCLGGMELYNGKPIFHSLGDFVMDGGSYRRRQAAILDIEIENGTYKTYKITPTIITNELITTFAPEKVKQKMLLSWERVTKKLNQHFDDYPVFFKKQYKIEMFQHTKSTLKFLFQNKGLIGLLRLIMKRYEEVFRMGKWIAKDRSNDRRDDEAILKDRKKFSEKELYKH